MSEHQVPGSLAAVAKVVRHLLHQSVTGLLLRYRRDAGRGCGQTGDGEVISNKRTDADGIVTSNRLNCM